MITNERQYKIAKAQADTFQNSFDNFSSTTNTNVHPRIRELEKEAMKIKLTELLQEIQEYENLIEGKIAVTEVKGLEELPLALIKARIANRMTQSELAEKIGAKMQQIQRYEAERYESASLKTLKKIADQLNLKINADVQIKEIDAPEQYDVKNYPFKQMFQRNWFGNFSGSFNDAVLDSKNLLEKFFETAGYSNIKYSFTRKKVRTGSQLNEYALRAWYSQVMIKANQQIVTTLFAKELMTEAWIRQLAELSMEENSPVKAANYLLESGIRFVIEPQLEGTFLDGAALLWRDNSPIVALTLRHDRLDNFWFVLFHELAHVYLHLSEDLVVIFDDLDVKIDGIEKEADEFALNALIPNVVWKKSLVRFNPSNQVIINQAKTLKVHTALVAGRIRHETGKYYQFTDLIGQGEVRKLFFQELKN